MPQICVVGFGYVGSEVARLGAKRGHRVTAVDDVLVDRLNAGDRFCPNLSDRITATTDGVSGARDVDTVVVAVPTPVNASRSLDLTILEAVMESVVQRIAASTRSETREVIIESTIPPGMTRGVAKEILEAEGLVVGEDVLLTHAPERIDPGRDGWPIERIPRMVGSITEKGLSDALA